MKLLPENVPKIKTTHAHAATNARRMAGVDSRFGRNDAASKPSMTAIITAHFRIRQRFSMSATLPRIDAMPDSTCHAFENERARKNTQAKQMRLKTRSSWPATISAAKDLDRRAGDPSPSLRSGSG